MTGTRPSAELLTLLHELAAIAGLPGPAERPGPCDWSAWLELAEENEVAALLGSRAPQTAGATERPAEIGDALRAASIHAARENAFLHCELERLTKLLGAVTRPIALKGAALAWALYEHPGERAMADIDLLVPGPEAPRAASLLQAHGYEITGEACDHHHLPPLHHPLRDVTVELHTNLSTPPLPESLLARMRRQSRTLRLGAGGELRILDPVSALIHHALHALSDPVGSPLLRNLFEVAWMAARLEPAELDEAFARAREAGVERPVLTACSLATRFFGSVLSIPKAPAGALGFWCARRLGWVETGERGGWGQLRSSLARRHLLALRSARSDRGPRALVGAFAELLGSRTRRLCDALGARLRRAPAESAEVGAALLVESLETGEIHLLSGNALRAWQLAPDGIDGRELLGALGRSGLDRRESRQAVGALLDCGLLARRAA